MSSRKSKRKSRGAAKSSRRGTVESMMFAHLDAHPVREPMSTEDLVPLLKQVTPTERDLEHKIKEALSGPRLKETLAMLPSKKMQTAIKAMAAAGGYALLSSAVEGTGDFGGLAWRIYKWLVGVNWDKQGRFEGRYTLEPVGPRDYIFRPNPDDPFRFIRSTGDEIRPGPMHTDGGSIPRVAWAIPDLDPWTYINAYLIHDWDFIVHHCRPDESREFDAVNLTLGEGIYTLMMTGQVHADWRKAEIVYQAVSSIVGQNVWNRPWTPQECLVVMEP